MWIPEEFNPSANTSLRITGHAAVLPGGRLDLFAELRGWSSIIGIVTAIVGNILISFALNIQRYAHIRIDREYHESHLPLSRGGRTTDNSLGAHGPNPQEEVAEERAKINAMAPGPGKPTRSGDRRGNGAIGHLDEDAHESSPLLKTYDSTSTRTTSEKSSQEGETRKSYLRSPYWWAGIVLMTIGEAGNFLAYGFAPASIVSPLGVVALISNCIIAPIMLKERFRIRDGWGVLVAIAGAVTIVLSAKTREKKLGQDELWGAILRWEFLTYVAITAVLIIALMFASPRYGGRTILIDLGLVGLFGGYTALSTKGVASLLSDTLYMALTFPITYFLVAILVSSALMQIRYVNRSLQRFASTQVIPTQFVLFTIFVIIGSAVLYRDFESTTAGQGVKFIGGCLLTFFGVYLITSGRHRKSDEEEGEGEGEEEEEGRYSDISDEEGIHLVDDESEPQDQMISKQRTRDSNISPRAKVQRPQTPDRGHSKSSATIPFPYPETPNTSSPFRFPSSVRSDDSLTVSRSQSSDDPYTATTTSHTQLTPRSAQLSPFTRAQSSSQQQQQQQQHIQPPHTPTFVRLRPTQSHQQQSPNRSSAMARTTPGPYLRSPSTPTLYTDVYDQQKPSSRTRLRGGSPQATPAAEAALRAHLSPSSGELGAAFPGRGSGTGGPGTLNHASRGSFGRLLPGPLLSPLSSGLTVVIADSLLRGEGTGLRTGSESKPRGNNAASNIAPTRRRSSKRVATAAGVVGASNDLTAPETPSPALPLPPPPATAAAEGQPPRASSSMMDGQDYPGPGRDRATAATESDENTAQDSKTGQLQPISDSLGSLVGRRRNKSSLGSGSRSRSRSLTPVVSPSSSVPAAEREGVEGERRQEEERGK